MYSLTLKSGVLDPGFAWVADLTRPARDWRRTIRLQGGPWLGSFTLHDRPAVLQHAFDTWLGYHLVEKCGDTVTWAGLIYELELVQPIRRLRSLDLVANAVQATYTDYAWQSGDEPIHTTRTTAWAAQAESIARYGRREQVLYLQAPRATAEALRDAALAQFAYPWPRPIGSHAPAAHLVVRACGYAHTAHWLFARAGDGTQHPVSDWIAAIVGSTAGLSPAHGGATATAGDCQFLRTGTITANALLVTEYTPTPRRAWDLLLSLVRLGDGGPAPWRLHVTPGRVVDYGPVDLTPRLFLRGGVLYEYLDSARPFNPWSIAPCVVRDMACPRALTEPGSFLADPRDLLVDEVEVRADGRVLLKTALYSEADLLAAELAYLRQEPPDGDTHP